MTETNGKLAISLARQVWGAVLTLALFWLILSVLTSGIKASRGWCGSHYGIEDYKVNGDLFCKVSP